MKESLNKFLTELMGECWHEFPDDATGFNCLKCGRKLNVEEIIFWLKGYQSSEGFFKLWDFSIKQDWWEDFLSQWWKVNSLF